jgi:hypothetical protein
MVDPSEATGGGSRSPDQRAAATPTPQPAGAVSWMPIALAVVTLFGTICSAGFAALAAYAGTQATAQVSSIKEQFNRESTFSSRLESALTNLVVDPDKSRAPSDKAATEVFSLFAIAQGAEEKRSLLYIALSSRSEDLEELISEFLGNSNDSDDKSLAVEFRAEEIALQALDNVDVKPGEDTLPGSSSPSTKVISNVTPDTLSGWVYLGIARDVSNANATRPGATASPAGQPQLQNGKIVRRTI